MNRGIVEALVVLGAIFFALFVFDRPDFMRLFSGLRGFVLDHLVAVIVGVLALIAARLVLHSPQQIDRF